MPYDEKLPPQRENQARVVAHARSLHGTLPTQKIGEGAFFRIQRFCERLDELLSRAQKSPSRKRRNMRRAAGRMRLRIENLVQELHRQAARFSFEYCCRLETGDGGAQQAQDQKQDRAQLAEPGTLPLFQNKAAEAGAIVLDVRGLHNQGWTGELEGLGSAVVVAQDGERMDRDYNGARGIYLRALGDIPALRALLSECAARANNSCLSGNMSKTAESVLFGSS